jgi:hypothetical protein
LEKTLLITRLATLCTAALVAASAAAQLPESLRPYLVFQDNPDRFFEFTQTNADGSEVQGWVFTHWTGEWQASGEETLTRLQVVMVRHDPGINTPPVLLGVTAAVGPGGLAIRQVRQLAFDSGPETENLPPGFWLFPASPEVGQTWSTGTADHFRWSRIEDLDGPNPNPLVQTDRCVVKMTVAAERTASGELSVEVEESHWGEGQGLVWINSWRGELGGIDEGASIADQAQQVLDRLEELPVTITLQAVPQDVAATAEDQQGGPTQ